MNEDPAWYHMHSSKQTDKSRLIALEKKMHEIEQKIKILEGIINGTIHDTHTDG